MSLPSPARVSQRATVERASPSLAAMADAANPAVDGHGAGTHRFSQQLAGMLTFHGLPVLPQQLRVSAPVVLRCVDMVVCVGARRSKFIRAPQSPPEQKITFPAFVNKT